MNNVAMDNKVIVSSFRNNMQLYLLFTFSIILVIVLSMNQISGQIPLPPNVPGNYSLNDYGRIIEYCFDHTDQILSGKNPVQDLVNANLIPSTFANKNCHDIEIEEQQFQDFMR